MTRRGRVDRGRSRPHPRLAGSDRSWDVPAEDRIVPAAPEVVGEATPIPDRRSGRSRLSASPTRRTVSKPASPQSSRRASKARRRSSSGRRPVTRTTESPTRIPLSTASRCHHRRSPMSSRDIRRAWMGFTLPARGRWLGPIGGTLVNRLAAAMPVWVNSIAARVPWAWIASTTRVSPGCLHRPRGDPRPTERPPESDGSPLPRPRRPLTRPRP